MKFKELVKELEQIGDIEDLIENAYNVDFRESEIRIQGEYDSDLFREHPEIKFHLDPESGFIKGEISRDLSTGEKLIVKITFT